MKGRAEVIFYVSIGAGMALGTSSFTMLSELFKVVPSLWVVGAILLAGLFCIVIASSVAELASMYPSSPGIRTYLKMAFGNEFSLFLVHLYLIFIVLIAGVESYVFAQVIAILFPGAPPMLIVLTLLAAVVTTNLLGLELPRWMQITTAFVLIASILLLGAYGAFLTAQAPGDGLHLPLGDGATNLLLLPAGAAMAIFLFIGFEWVTPLGLRPASYERKIPMSMPMAILINMVAYSFFVLGMASQLPEARIVSDAIPQVPYFSTLFGTTFGSYFAGALSVLAIFSTFNAGIMGSSRLIFVLTREGNLPQWCAKISLSTGAPVGAILLLGILAVISALFVVTFELEGIAIVIGATIICFVYAAFMLAVVRLRKLAPATPRPHRTAVPAPLRWLLIVVLPLIGIYTLFSLPEWGLWPVAGMAIFAVLALGLTRYSLMLAGRRPSRPAPPRRSEPSPPPRREPTIS